MGIRVSTELNPKGVQQGAEVVKRSLNDVDKAATSSERRFDSLSQELTQYAAVSRTVSQRQQVTARNFGTLSKGAKQADSDFFKLQKGGLSNLSFQLQDVAVQAQAGTDKLIILAQQAPQALQSFGPAGAIAGTVVALAAAISGPLLVALGDSTDATKELSKAQESLDTILSRSEDGVISFTSKIERLSQVSEQAARVQLAAGVADATEVIRQSGRLITQQIDGIETGFSRLSLVDFSELSASLGRAATENLDAIRQFREGAFDDRTTQNFIRDLSGATAAVEGFFGVSLEQSARLVQAFSRFDGSSEQATQLSQAVAQIAEETEFSNENLNKFAKALADSAADAEIAQTAVDLLRGALEDTDTVVSQNTESFQSNQNTIANLSQQLAVLQTEYSQGARAAAILEAQQRAGASAASEQGKQIALLVGQLYDQREAINAVAEAERKQAAKQKEILSQQDAFSSTIVSNILRQRQRLQQETERIAFGLLSPRDKLIIEEEEKLKVLEQYGKLNVEQQRVAEDLKADVIRESAKKQRDLLMRQLGDLSPMSPLEQINTEEQQKLALIQQYGQLNAEAQAEAEQLRTAVVKQAAAKRDELDRIELQNTLSAAANGFNALSQLSAQFIGDQDNRNKTAFALSKAFAISSAGLNLSLAIVQALADPSALTLSQKIANFAEIASAGAGLISNIKSANYATGGFVQGAGSGTSDSINANLSNGEFVTRASVTRRNRGALEYMNRTGEMPSGGSNVNVTVINNTSSQVSTSTDSNGDLQVQIDERINRRVPGLVADQVRNPNSQFNRDFRSTYNAPRR